MCQGMENMGEMGKTHFEAKGKRVVGSWGKHTLRPRGKGKGERETHFAAKGKRIVDSWEGERDLPALKFLLQVSHKA